MGAWGHRSFENDSALDWLGDLADGGASVHDALEGVLGSEEEYLEVDEGSSALAAAELVAAARSQREDRLNDDARAWLATGAEAITAEDARLAARAVERVLDEETSELAQLWAEGDATAWRADVAELLARLRG